MSPRRSLLVVSPSADGYGSDRALVGIAPIFAERYDVTVVAAADGPTVAMLREAGIEVIIAPDFALRRKFATPTGIIPASIRVARTAALLRRLHRERNFAGVYVNTVANMILPFIRTVVPAPVVVHVREVPRAGDRQNRLIFSQVNRVASLALSNSSHTAAFVRRVEPRLTDRIEVVCGGVDDPGVVGRRPDASTPPLEIVCVGRLHPQKGQAVLLDALGPQIAQGADYRIHFWGDALAEHAHIEAALHEQVERYGIADRVVWHGYSSDITAMYTGMDLAVMPSTWPEGFSLVTVEAQAAGLPVIATQPGGPTDIVIDGETGRLVGLVDPDGIRQAVKEMSDPNVRERYSAAGRARYLDRFTTERSARGVAEAVTRLVG